MESRTNRRLRKRHVQLSSQSKESTACIRDVIAILKVALCKADVEEQQTYKACKVARCWLVATASENDVTLKQTETRDMAAVPLMHAIWTKVYRKQKPSTQFERALAKLQKTKENQQIRRLAASSGAPQAIQYQ